MAKPAPLVAPFSSPWPDLASPPPDPQEFVKDSRYDCVVVGAGITGCAAALHLAERKARVCILDAAFPGAGTSGRANGQVMAELTASPDRVVRLYGPARGEEVLQVAAGAPDLVFGLISRHAIACDAERSGWIEGTPWHWTMAGLEKRVASWRRRGAPVDLLGPQAMRDLVGTTTYVGGIHDRRAGILNPLSYTRGLAAAACRAGARLHGGTEALALVRQGRDWRVLTTKGNLTAATVIAATNAYTGKLLPNLRHPVVCVYGVQSATRPLATEMRHVLPQRQGFSDLRKKFFRLDSRNRLLVGGPGGFWPPSTARSLPFRWVEHGLRKIFPELRDTPFEHRWYAKGAATLDFLPRLYEPAPGLFSALGFAGRGIAMGTALGSLLARRVQGEPAESIPFPTTSSRLPFGLGRAT